MRALTIGQMARQAGVGVETVRFYERQGLLDAQPRRASGYRQYAPEMVARLQFIRRAILPADLSYLAADRYRNAFRLNRADVVGKLSANF